MHAGYGEFYIRVLPQELITQPSQWVFADDVDCKTYCRQGIDLEITCVKLQGLMDMDTWIKLNYKRNIVHLYAINRDVGYDTHRVMCLNTTVTKQR